MPRHCVSVSALFAPNDREVAIIEGALLGVAGGWPHMIPITLGEYDVNVDAPSMADAIAQVERVLTDAMPSYRFAVAEQGDLKSGEQEGP